MRRNLSFVPCYLCLGRVPADVADSVVRSGRGHSLRGRSVVVFDLSTVQDLAPDLKIAPALTETLVGICVRALSASGELNRLNAQALLSSLREEGLA